MSTEEETDNKSDSENDSDSEGNNICIINDKSKTKEEEYNKLWLLHE